MKTYFATIRRWCAVMAWLVPILFWSGFLLLILGAGFWSFIPWVLALLAAISFPPGLAVQSATRSTPGMPRVTHWVSALASAMLYFHFIQLPEARALFARVMSGEALRHWLPISASFILLAVAIYKRVIAVNALTDDAIYDFYNTGTSAHGDRTAK